MVEEILKIYKKFFLYPDGDMEGSALKLSELLKGIDLLAYEDFMEFRKAIIPGDIDTLREIYTITFDLNPSCPPYLGNYLFEDSYKKGDFMAGLRRVYKDNNFEYDGKELPDHLAIVLDFIAFKGIQDQEVRIIIDEAMFFSLKKMEERFKSVNNSYKFLIKSLKGFLERRLRYE
jgi:nitrate reductase delta subunit